MRIDLLRTQHPWLTMSTILLVLMAFWSLFTAQNRSTQLFNAAASGQDSAILVAKAGHVLPILDRHIPFAIEKRNGRYTFVVKSHQ